MKYILYSEDENAFADIYTILSVYDVYQFIIENEIEEDEEDLFEVDMSCKIEICQNQWQNV